MGGWFSSIPEDDPISPVPLSLATVQPRRVDDSKVLEPIGMDVPPSDDSKVNEPMVIDDPPSEPTKTGLWYIPRIDIKSGFLIQLWKKNAEVEGYRRETYRLPDINDASDRSKALLKRSSKIEEMIEFINSDKQDTKVYIYHAAGYKIDYDVAASMDLLVQKSVSYADSELTNPIVPDAKCGNVFFYVCIDIKHQDFEYSVEFITKILSNIAEKRLGLVPFTEDADQKYYKIQFF